MIDELSQVYEGTELGADSTVGPFCVIGAAPAEPAEPTAIGRRALIRSHTVIYAGTRIGDHFQSGHGVLVREHNVIGHHVSIGSHSVIEHHVHIGDGVRVHSQAFIPEFTVLEEGCWIGPGAVLTNAPHPRCPGVKLCLRGPRIGRGAKIGANATILPGLIIGEMALVGAGAVVTEDVPGGVVVAGNPARIIKKTAELTCPYGNHEGPYGEIYAVYQDTQ
jgi:acetyltransferase-like isoleucine patch superfamily enzyme